MMWTPEGQEKYNRERQRHYRKANPDKCRAHYLLRDAVKRGEVAIPKLCSRCGRNPTRLHAHHADYSKPLDVEWLCPTCHYNLHHPGCPRCRPYRFKPMVSKWRSHL